MLVTEFGIVGGAVSEVHLHRNQSPMLVTEFGIVGGAVSEVHSQIGRASWRETV
jgi:hypothetical protein